MTAAGWVFMIGSWGVILAVFVFSMVRTLRPKERESGEPADMEKK